MPNDEEAIRKLVETWLAASKKDDIATMLDLLAEDVVFRVPGKEPFGKKEFEAVRQKMNDVKLEGKSEIQEIKVLGDWAWMRNFLRVTFTPVKGAPTVHSGCVLTILHKNPN